MNFTPTQLREARRLLGIGRERLAKLADVSVWQVRQFEQHGHLRFDFYASQDRVRKMVRALETDGVTFTNDEEQGVKLRKLEP